MSKKVSGSADLSNAIKAVIEIGDSGVVVELSGNWSRRSFDIATLAFRREIQQQLLKRKINKEISDE